MSELKFRAWDLKRLEEFGQPCMSNPFTFNDIYIDCIGRRYLHCTIVLQELIFYLDECEIMQYTGLKDKNGNEVYENDIIKWYYYDKPKIFIIKWNDNNCCFKAYDKDDRLGNYFVYINSQNIEILGNIYENPELLEGI